MRGKTIVLSLVLTLSLSGALADDHAGEMSADQMAAMMAAATPNDHHKHLSKLAGTWSAQGKFWMDPSAPAMETEGKTVNKMIMDGRFLESRYSSSFMGMPFTGMGLDGYDNTAGKHVGTWIDTMGTTMMVSSGDCSEGGKVMTTVGEYTDPVTRQPTKMKMTVTLVDDDTYNIVGWNQSPDGEFVKSMEITYERQ